MTPHLHHAFISVARLGLVRTDGKYREVESFEQQTIALEGATIRTHKSIASSSYVS
jgi:hypothetical protein